MKKILIIFSVGFSISVACWLKIPSTEVLGSNIESVSLDESQNVTLQNINAKSTSPLVVKIPLAKEKESIVKKDTVQRILNSKQAMQITETILGNIINNQAIDFHLEKLLLNYLKETSNEQVYQIIVEKLQAANAGTESDDRLIEYSLSLLAAIDTPRASEIFFTTLAQKNLQGSSAIYTINKSISKLTKNTAYTNLVQQTFAQANDENPFIRTLATAIAYNAKVEQIDYLFTYIDRGSKNKSTVASYAMNEIQSEYLVPHISSYISDGSTKKVQNTALNALANMGQYEAASALITWSSTQPRSSAKQIAALFRVALRRSPSTKRAVEKEIYLKEFVSEELKELIISLSHEGL